MHLVMANDWVLFWPLFFYFIISLILIDNGELWKALCKVSQFVSNTEQTEKKHFVHEYILCVGNCWQLKYTFFRLGELLPFPTLNPESWKKKKIIMLIIFEYLVGGTISSPTAAATVITAVTAAMQVTSKYLATTESIFHEKRTFTVQGKVFRENWESFLPSDKGCLHVYIYTDLDTLLTSKQLVIDDKQYRLYLYYSINFNGLQNRRYYIR